jgi:hypothetical protein
MTRLLGAGSVGHSRHSKRLRDPVRHSDSRRQAWIIVIPEEDQAYLLEAVAYMDCNECLHHHPCRPRERGQVFV